MGKLDSQRQGGSKDIASPAIHGLELILAAVYQGGFRRLVIDCDDDEVCGPEERLCGLEDQVGQGLEIAFGVEEDFREGEDKGRDAEEDVYDIDAIGKETALAERRCLNLFQDIAKMGESTESEGFDEQNGTWIGYV
ncbi:hypothetical protein HO133_000154 [Letharia lupina]|uniref:Uncharacterized protein n=1 Tax=Letharia lupina TaxID=560253 RepID=A0A8H6FCF5_9LECA|nr:uncharacterized protein HO133_000154 [Letharia lupina]KAF6223312.1 hypothetical protein HO133_000154 [Letharia lupina]